MAGGSLSFAEQIEFFRNKVNIPTEHWDDLLGAAHDRAFVVAGAMQADLLADLRAAADKAIANGTTIDEFRKDFDALVDKHGWTGWTGEGSEAGRAWRTRVIYETNLRASYAAARYQQLQAQKNERPYWRYRHNDTVITPRPEHVAWDGKILSADDPWWSTHYPPNGWGCRCYVESLSDRDLKRLGLDPPAPEPPAPINPATGLPVGIDRGWDYAPGASVADQIARQIADKAASLPGPIARAWGRSILDFLASGVSSIFAGIGSVLRRLFSF